MLLYSYIGLMFYLVIAILVSEDTRAFGSRLFTYSADDKKNISQLPARLSLLSHGVGEGQKEKYEFNDDKKVLKVGVIHKIDNDIEDNGLLKSVQHTTETVTQISGLLSETTTQTQQQTITQQQTTTQQQTQHHENPNNHSQKTVFQENYQAHHYHQHQQPHNQQHHHQQQQNQPQHAYFDEQAQWDRDSVNYADSEVHYFFPQSNYPRQLDNISSDEGRLLEHLFLNYNPLARPVLDSSHTVPVNLRFSLLQIQDLNIRNQILTSTGFLILEWKDERLVWDRGVSSLDELVVRGSHIWRPEFAVINGADSIYEEYNEFKALVKSDGTIRWEPGGIFKTICTIDITFYPFDTQKCEIKFGAWSYHTTKMNLSTTDTIIRQDSYEKNGEWEVTGTYAARDEFAFECCLTQRFSFIAFEVRLRRRHTFYVMNVIVPGLLTSAVLLSLFYCVPSQKVHIGVAALLSFRLFLVNVADTVPRTSDHIPLLGIYLTCTMAITTLAMVATVVVGNLYERKDRPVPVWLKRLLLLHVARLLCMRRKDGSEVCSLGTPSKKKKKRRRSKSWVGDVVECGWVKGCCGKGKKADGKDEEDNIQQYSSSEQLDEKEDLEMIASYNPRNRRVLSNTVPNKSNKKRSRSFDVTAALVSIGMKHVDDKSKKMNAISVTLERPQAVNHHQEGVVRRQQPSVAHEATTSTASATPTSDKGCPRSKMNYAHEWAFLASVCDRVFFWLCLFFILATTLLLFHPLTTSRFFKIPVIDKT